MAQRKGSKKRTTSKKSTAKKKTARKNGSQLTLTEIIFKKELASTLTFVAGLVLLFVALFSGGDGSLWEKIHNLYFALFGICGYYIPLTVLFLGVISILNKEEKVHFVKAGEVFILFVLICSLLHVNTVADRELGYFESMGNVIETASDGAWGSLLNGGIIGALFGGLVFLITKSALVSDLIIVILIIADIMFLFGITLLKLFMKMEKPAKKVGEITGDVIEKSKTEYEKQKKLYDERSNEAKVRRLNEKKKDVDPARIVNDFFATADVTEEDIFDKGASSSKINDGNVVKFAPPAEESKITEIKPDPEIPDIFAMAEMSVKQKMDISVSDDDFIEIEAAETQRNDPEKLKPLSKKEAQALTASLDDAVAKAPVAEYKLPPLDCLNRPKSNSSDFSENELKTNGERLIAALNSFNVSASIVGVVPGPTVTRYELSPAPGVKISKFVGLADDLALHMAAPAGLRIEAPIPNKAAIGIEIPNKSKTTVTFREIIDTDKFKNAGSKLTVALGKDIAGTPIYSNLAKMPHLLVAGTTGSGKSVCLNSMIVSILYNASPDEVKLLLIDPKQVEFGVYNGLPHLLVPVVSDPRKASGALGWAVTEMLSRYKTLNANGVRDIGAYNSLCEERDDLTKMSHIVIFIDELADLMTVAPAEVEDAIQRLAQMARAAGMHLVVATQRPSVDVITGVIKANIPSRIALTVKSQVDSRTIIDSAGAEKLMGNGDMLYYPVGIPKPVRVQGCYLSDSEIENVVSFIKANCSTNYDDNVQQEIDRQAVSEKKKGGEDASSSSSSGIDANDELFMRAVELFVSAPEKASISALQRHLGLGFAKAGRLMDTLEQKGIVGPHMGSKPRNVLVTKAQWYEMNAMSSTEPAAVVSEETDEDYYDTENYE